VPAKIAEVSVPEDGTYLSPEVGLAESSSRNGVTATPAVDKNTG
jgi:hypothetical protein